MIVIFNIHIYIYICLILRVGRCGGIIFTAFLCCFCHFYMHFPCFFYNNHVLSLNNPSHIQKIVRVQELDTSHKEN